MITSRSGRHAGPPRRRRSWGWLVAGALLAPVACARQKAYEYKPKPAPVRSEAALGDEQRAGLRVAAAAPNGLGGDERSAAEPPPGGAAATFGSSPGAAPSVQSDILLVNDTVVTIAEVLYPLREEIAELRASESGGLLRAELQRLIGRAVQQDANAILFYGDAKKRLTDQQRTYFDTQTGKELERIVQFEFGASVARFERHLAEHGLTLQQYKDRLLRQLIVRQYAREVLMPRISATRADMLDYYQRNLDKFRSEDKRALRMIEAPFAAFLPEGESWESASAASKATAKLAAAREIRAAHAELATRPFADVARERSRGAHASQGGEWGTITRPLRGIYAEVSRRAFTLGANQHSEPIETETGWYIVGCGEVSEARLTPFAEAQDQIRAAMSEERFAQVYTAYVRRLATNVSVSSVEAFVNEAVRRAMNGVEKRL